MLSTLAGGLILVFGGGGLFGQPAGDRPRFEAATLKSVPIGGGAAVIRNPGRIMYEQISLPSLVAWAYDVMPYQLSGPDWWNSTFYKLEAVMPPDTPAERVPIMLQALLEERFHLLTHREKKDIPVYAVTIAKRGLRLHQAQTNSAPTTSFSRTERRITGALSVPVLLRKVMVGLDRPMVDMTGLVGKYDVNLVWSMDPPSADEVLTPTGVAGKVTRSEGRGTLFSAMEEQLGLRVEARRAAVEMLTVDHVDRVPIEN